MCEINYAKPKIRDLRALAKLYNKVTGAKRVLYFKPHTDEQGQSGWWFDRYNPGHSWHLGAHCRESFAVLDEHLAEYQMSVGKDER